MQIDDLTKEVHGLAMEMRDSFKKISEKMDNGFKEVSKEFTSVREEMDGGFKSVREEIHDVLQAVNDHATEIDGKIDNLTQDVTNLTKTVTNLPDKNYVDEKIGSLRGDVVTIARETALRAVGAN